MPSYNSILRLSRFEDEGKHWTYISFVTTDHQEIELEVETSLLTAAKDFEAIPILYSSHHACCEHPDGCPEETNTEKLVRKFNE